MSAHPRPTLRRLAVLSLVAALASVGLWWLYRAFDLGGLRGQTAAAPATSDAALAPAGAGASSSTPDPATRAVFTSPGTLATSPASPRAETDAATVQDPRAALQLSFERGIVVPGGLSQRESQRLLSAEDFLQRMAEFAGESARDPDSADITRVYRAAVERALRESGTQARLDAFACGTQLCMGALSGGDEDGYRMWSEFFAKRGSAPSYAMNTHVRTDARGAAALRFAFTVDPTFSGVVIEGD